MATNAELERRIAKLERRLRDELKQRVANVAQVSSLTLTATDGKGEQVDGRPSDASSARSVRRMQHSGFRSRPPNQSQAVFLTTEGGAQKAVVIAEDDGISITLDEGEAALYSPNAPTCKIRLDKNGKLTVESAAGQNIEVTAGAGAFLKFNGGTQPIARVGDTAGPWPIVGGNPTVLG